MTQIKLRRDTSANFTSKNPVLGIGEPAYETDTKKLKIGDGTTAYTQLEYFSAGGGSTDISATLPLKIVDGVISLEVDGQTIQIVDGKLHANLDELNNTVNTLSDDVGTSFDLINILQTDVQSNTESITNLQNALSDKQDKLISEKPLVLGKQVIKNYKGMTIADNKVSSTGGQSFTATDVSTFTINTGNAAPPVSYIEIPYKSGQVIQVPTNKWNDTNGKLGLFFGSWQDDGNFLVTAAFTPEDSYKNSNGCFGGLFNNGPIAMPSTETTPALKTYSNAREKANSYISLVPDKNSYFQILMSDTLWSIQLYASGLSNNSVKAYTWVIYNDNIGTTKFDVITPKTTTCLIMMNNSSLKVPTDSIGLYDWGTRLQWTQEGYQNFLANKGPNLFSFEQQGKHDSLSLSIGSGLSVVDGKLTADTVDAYTKTETNALLDAKEDKITAVAPLDINQTTVRSVTNGNFLTDTSVTLNSAFSINYTTSANARALIYAPGASGVGVTPTSFIQIPFTLGDLISFPFEKDNDSNIGLVFGYWKDGLFYPTMLYKTSTTYGPDSSSYAPFAFVSEAGKSSLEKIATYYGGSSAIGKSTLTYNQSFPLNATNYIQVTKNAEVPTVNMWFTTAGATWPNSGFTQRMYTSDTTVLENFNKTNVCLLLSSDKSKTINVTKVTRRELGNTVLDPTADALTTALSTYSNSFDATAEVVTNDLSLAIGSGLSVVDGKLTATGSASMPSNRYIDLTLGAEGEIYTAPADGWFTLCKIAGATNKYLQIGTEMLTDIVFPSSPGDLGIASVPVKKGDRVSPMYNVVGPTQYFRFIYAEGSK